jgi:RNA polymerase subunit RPABC4/transcription elongation factor Spt4
MEDFSGILTGIAIYAGVIVAAFWLALIIWAYRDMKARSRDAFAQLFVAVMIALLNLPGLLIYLLLRPRETLSEAYERSLEEEALLQEIEEKPTCPGCAQRVQETWQVCPACNTRLKKVCHNCRNLLELSWTLCPYCAAPQSAGYEETGHVRTRPAATSETRAARSARYQQQQTTPSGELQFVEGDDYQ